MLKKTEIRAIYDQGVDAVAATIKRLYEMIEVEDERMHKLIGLATAAHLRKIEQLSARVIRLEEELANKAQQIHGLKHQVKDLSEQLRGAQEKTRQAREAHLASVMKNSQNSSLPPSTDPHKKTRSLREKSGKKPGGQVGHRGATLNFIGKPDRLVIHTPEACHLCGSSLSGSEVVSSERRQVHDLPPQKIEVAEHLAQTKICGRCGVKNKAEFPAGITAPVQYGEGVRAMAAIPDRLPTSPI